MIFLFPNDCFDPQQPDIGYRDRFIAFKNAGFKTALIEIESLDNSNTKIKPAPEANEVIIYLGWMLSSTNYKYLVEIIEKAGAISFTSHQEYLNAHYLPNWYPLIKDLTPETKIFPVDCDLEIELKNLDWEQYFIKDYVKSLKNNSIIDRPKDIKLLLAEMEKYRGTIEGGICVRRVEDFFLQSEKRYFLINHRAFSAYPNDSIPEIVLECAKRINSNFFSLDVIKHWDGRLRIVEIGDGQVSDLVGWDLERYIEVLGKIEKDCQ